jgi:hypothetical protein
LFSIDEKTAMQATSRRRATAALRRGRPELRELEYVRHGTASLMAATNVTDGTVHPKIIVANSSATFIELLTELGPRRPSQEDPPHRGQRVQPHLQGDQSLAGRASPLQGDLHPAHASWSDIVEIFLSILARRMLRRGDLASRQDLIDKTLCLHRDLQSERETFRWSYDAKLLRAA